MGRWRPAAPAQPLRTGKRGHMPQWFLAGAQGYQRKLKLAFPFREPPQRIPSAASRLTGTAYQTNPTSIFLRAELFCINGLGRSLVTICGLDPCALRGDDLRGDREVAIDLLDVGFRRGGLADAQTGAVVTG